MAIGRVSFLLGAVFILLALFSYWFIKRPWRKIVDEKFSAAFVKDKLSLSGDVTAEKLIGGFSGAYLFTVTSGKQKYVVRFFQHKSLQARKEEIASIKIASQAGYGPYIYYANADEGVEIMEYLTRQKITEDQRNSRDLYVALARLIQKIHRGPKNDKSKDIFKKVREGFGCVKKIVETKHITDFPIDKIETIIETLNKACASMTFTAPCHGDLNPSNIFFLGKEFRVIDFEGAAQANPYLDIATVAINYCFTPAFEHILLSSYLEREPSAKEKAQLYVMKQVVWLRSGLSFLKRVPEEISAYATTQVPSREDFLKSFDAGEIDLEKPENKMICGKSMLDIVLANSKSQEFRDAIELVVGKSINL